MKRWFVKNKTPILPPFEGYNHWASTYAVESNPIKDFSNKLVEQWLPDLTGKVVLDAGCGTGHFCSYAEKKNASRIVGIDLSPAMIEKAKMNCRIGEFHCADLSTMAFESATFDVIICALVLGHIENVEPILNLFCAILKEKGELVITDFHPYQTKHHAKRTFKDPQTNKTTEIKHYHHSIEAIMDRLKKSRLSVEHFEEPLWNNTPVVYGIHSKKMN
jgi:malonyl-CoA O-methyltransferase